MNEGAQKAMHRVLVRIRNGGAAERKLVLEPWAEEYVLAPSDEVDVVAEGPEGDSLEIEFADDSVTVYGWPRSVVSLFHDGVELKPTSGERGRVPPVPKRGDP